MAQKKLNIPTYTFEQVWAALMELRASQQELSASQKETDRQIRETRTSQQETERLIKESQLEVAKQQKLTDKKIGDLSNRFGELAEHLVAPNIKEKFNELGYTFEGDYQNFKVYDSVTGETLAELDIVMENGEAIIVVEVKAKPKQEHIEEFAEKMKVLRKWYNARGVNKKLHGAVAGAIMNDSLRKYVHKMGFYSIEQTGDTVKINVPKGFKPRHW